MNRAERRIAKAKARSGRAGAEVRAPREGGAITADRVSELSGELFEAGMRKLIEQMASISGGLDSGDPVFAKEAQEAVDEVVGDSDKLFERAVSHGWRGCKTVEQAKEALAEAVVEGVQLRRSIFALLCAIDRDAHAMMHAQENLPRCRLAREIYEEVRERLLPHRWNGATDEEVFDIMYVEAVEKRFLAVSGMRGKVRDSVVDELAPEGVDFRIQSDVTDEVEAAFRARIDEQVRRCFEMPETEKKAREMVTQLRAQELLLTEDGDGKGWEALEPHVPADMPAELRALHGTGHPVDRIVALQAAARALAGGWDKPTKRVFSGESWDKDMMGMGTALWDQTYKLGMDDAGARTVVDKHSAVMRRKHPDLGTDLVPVLRFAAKWACHAFQRVMTSHTYAAALMCSDADRQSVETIELQWSAFMVVVPDGVLVARDGQGQVHDFTRVTVAIYDGEAELMLYAPVRGKEGFAVTGDGQTCSDLTDLLTGGDEELDQGTEMARAKVMAKRLVVGLLLAMQHADNFKQRVSRARGAHVAKNARDPDYEPEHRTVIVGSPIQIDCRAQVARYIRHGRGRSGKHSPPSVQVLVRGHYRRQVVGIGRLGRKVIWIQPFWRGAKDAPILSRPKLVGRDDG